MVIEVVDIISLEYTSSQGKTCAQLHPETDYCILGLPRSQSLAIGAHCTHTQTIILYAFVQTLSHLFHREVWVRD